MKFSVQGKPLSVALADVMRVVPKHPARVALQNVCISANGGLEIYGTDMEIGIRRTVQANIAATGSILLDAKRLNAIVKKCLVKDDVHFGNGDGFKVELRGKRKRFALIGEDPAEFPAVPAFPAVPDCTVPAETLGFLVKRSLFAVAGEESRYAIHGALLSVEGDGTLRIVGTDGKRLAVASRKVWDGKVKPWEALLPPLALGALLAALPKKYTGTIAIKIEENRVLFQGPDVVVVAAKIPGTFPAWREVMPSRLGSTVTMETDALQAAIQEAGILATEGSHAVALDIGPFQISVKVDVVNVGTVETEVDAELDGGPATFYFNPKYIFNFLNVTQSKQITLSYGDTRCAVLFSDGDGLEYVVMPISLENDA